MTDHSHELQRVCRIYSPRYMSQILTASIHYLLGRVWAQECGYDGGDCCKCTCVRTASFRCGHNGFRCLDPEAGEYILGCEVVPVGPPPVSTCVTSTPRHWIVESTAGANLLADSTRCSGGIIEVEWKGHVFVNRTIYVIHGAVLNVVGESDAVADGGGSTQLFGAINGSLRVTNVQMIGGAGFHGGAISATQRSNVTLTRVNFSSNTADGFGGAIHLDNSLLQLADSATFTGNSAIYGGAVYIGSTSIFKQCVGRGEVYRFIDNRATHGGAFYASSSSNFVGTTQDHYTAVSSYSSVSHYAFDHFDDTNSSGGETQAETFFINNTAESSGGAVYIGNRSSWTWVGESILDGNTADFGGALFVGDWTTVEWQGAARFVHNRARKDGGAVASDVDVWPITLNLRGGVSFSNNTCGGRGGAMALCGEIDLDFGDTASEFRGNSAAVFGGAIYMAEAIRGHQFANVRFTENQAQVTL